MLQENKIKALYKLYQLCKNRPTGFRHDLGYIWIGQDAGYIADHFGRSGYIKSLPPPAWAIKAGVGSGYRRFTITRKGVKAIQKHLKKTFYNPL